MEIDDGTTEHYLKPSYAESLRFTQEISILGFSCKEEKSFFLGLPLIIRAISTQEKCPQTENFPKTSLLKVENFQLQNFFRRLICACQSHFTNFRGKFS